MDEYLFCPDEEKKPKEVLQHLRIQRETGNELSIHWRPRMRYATRLYRFCEELGDQIEMVQCSLRSYSQTQKRRAQQILKSAVDGAGFLQSYDRGNMGWPVVIGAAATLVEEAGGVIVTNGFGWFVPNGDEVRWLLKPL